MQLSILIVAVLVAMLAVASALPASIRSQRKATRKALAAGIKAEKQLQQQMRKLKFDATTLGQLDELANLPKDLAKQQGINKAISAKLAGFRSRLSRPSRSS